MTSIILFLSLSAVGFGADALRVQVRIGTGIEKKEPVGVSETFDQSVGELIGWSLVQGATEPTEVTHLWTYKGVSKKVVTLPIKSSFYRTFSRKSILGQPGTWTLQVKDSAGKVLAEQTFNVTAAEEKKTPTP